MMAWRYGGESKKTKGVTTKNLSGRVTSTLGGLYGIARDSQREVLGLDLKNVF